MVWEMSFYILVCISDPPPDQVVAQRRRLPATFHFRSPIIRPPRVEPEVKVIQDLAVVTTGCQIESRQ